MPKLLIALFLLGLISCTADKKLSGAYRSNQLVKGSYAQLILFKSDSTLQYTIFGKRQSRLDCDYKVTGKVLRVIFNYDQIYSLRNDQQDTISTLDTYPWYVFFRSTKCYFVLNIHHRKLVTKTHYPGETSEVKFIKVN